MHRITLAVVVWACAGSGWSLRMSSKRAKSTYFTEDAATGHPRWTISSRDLPAHGADHKIRIGAKAKQKQLAALNMLLLAFNPAKAFKPLHPRAHYSVHNPSDARLGSVVPSAELHRSQLRSAGTRQGATSPWVSTVGEHMFALQHPHLRVGDAQMFDAIPLEPVDEEEDVFQEMIDELTPLQRRVKDVNGVFFDIAQVLFPMVGGLAGWIFNPFWGGISNYLSVGAGAYPLIAFHRKCVTARSDVVKAVVSEYIKDFGISNIRPIKIAEWSPQYRVKKEKFLKQLQEIYGRFLRQCVTSDSGPTPQHLEQLCKLRTGLGLNWNQTREVFIQEMERLLDGEEAPPEQVLPKEFQKLFWFSDRVLQTGKGEDKVNTSEIEELLNFTGAARQRVIDRVASPLYRTAVAKTVLKCDIITAIEPLNLATGVLGLSLPARRRVHAEVYDAQAAVICKNTDMLTDEQTQVIKDVAIMLSVEKPEDRLIKYTGPLFRQAVRTQFLSDSGVGKADKLRKAITDRASNLMIRGLRATDTPDLRNLIQEEIRSLVAELVAGATVLMSKGKQTEAIADMDKAVSYAKRLVDVFLSFGFEEREKITFQEIEEVKEAIRAADAKIVVRLCSALALPEMADEAYSEALAAAAVEARPQDADIINAFFAEEEPEPSEDEPKKQRPNWE